MAEGVMRVYEDSINKYALSGPTYFSPLINQII